MIAVKQAFPEDAAHIEDTFRVSEEVRVGIDISKELREAIFRSNYSWILSVDDLPICVWGVETPTLLSKEGYIWMITTKAVEENVFVFVRTAQMFLKDSFNYYDSLWGWVDAKHRKAIRWLEWTGFQVDPENERGVCKFWRNK